MKKMLIIYFTGVLVALPMGFCFVKKENKRYNKVVTYGDVALFGVLALASWCGVAALAIVEISVADFWDKPICDQK